MRRILTATACLLLASLAVGVIAYYLASDTLDPFRRAADLDARLAVEVPVQRRRGDAKQRAAADALAGRLTLLQAAAVHRDLDAGLRPGQRDAWRFCTDGATGEERYCRQVLLQARMLADGRPESEAALIRLRRQLDAAMASGDVRLPGPEARGVPQRRAET